MRRLALWLARHALLPVLPMRLARHTLGPELPLRLARHALGVICSARLSERRNLSSVLSLRLARCSLLPVLHHTDRRHRCSAGGTL